MDVLEETELFFTSNLQNFSLIKLAINFFDDERIFMETFLNNRNGEKFEVQINIPKKQIQSKVDTYKIPHTFKKRLTNAIIYMLGEFKIWKTKNSFLFERCKASNILSSLQWSYKGKVDVAKTITNLLNIETIPFDDKFLISCKFCIEDKVVEFGKRLSKNFRFNLNEFDDTTLIDSYWSYYLKWDKSINFSDEDDLISCVEEALQDENLLAAEYFYNKLSMDDKANVNGILENDIADLSENILNFIFLNKLIRKKDILKTQTYFIFKAIIKNWMWHKNFNLVLNSYKQFLDEDDLFDIVEYIYELMESYPVNDKLLALFREFYYHFSTVLNTKILHIGITGELCELEDKVSIEMILNELNFEQKQEFFKTDVIVIKNYDLIKFVFEQVYKTDDEVAKLKSDFLNVQEDSLISVLLESPDIKVLKLVKDKASPSEDEWEQFNADITKDGNENFVYELKSLKFTDLIEFIEYLFYTTKHIELFERRKEKFVRKQMKDILFLFLNNVNKSEEDVDLLNSYFSRDLILTMLKDLFSSGTMAFFFRHYKSKIIDLFSLTEEEQFILKI